MRGQVAGGAAGIETKYQGEIGRSSASTRSIARGTKPCSCHGSCGALIGALLTAESSAHLDSFLECPHVHLGHGDMPRILQARKGTRMSRYVCVPYVPLFWSTFGVWCCYDAKYQSVFCFAFVFVFVFIPIGTCTCKASMLEKENRSGVANNARSH